MYLKTYCCLAQLNMFAVELCEKKVLVKKFECRSWPSVYFDGRNVGRSSVSAMMDLIFLSCSTLGLRSRHAHTAGGAQTSYWGLEIVMMLAELLTHTRYRAHKLELHSNPCISFRANKLERLGSPFNPHFIYGHHRHSSILWLEFS
jgi:hypothetical protein